MKRQALTPPFYPIIYVRGFAMGSATLEGAVADPYMGFNDGATKHHQRWDGSVEQLIFESPLVRLMKDYGYQDCYSQGALLPSDEELPERPLLIYRYYDQSSQAFGDGQRREIEQYAEGLGRRILELKQQYCGSDHERHRAFKVILVAHSMGGLIVRCLLQNRRMPSHDDVAGLVDKVVTYATPHKGIDLRVIGNVPSSLGWSNINNFSHERMQRFLGLPNDVPVNCLAGSFDPERFLCLVGTDHMNYQVAGGWSRRLVGPMSDGLVRIDNATVYDQRQDGSSHQAPRAFIHRSHSGDFGIVNSEEAYQNLTRFCFGDLRVDGRLEIEDISLPAKVEGARLNGKTIRASYHFECCLRPLGARWDLHRRTLADGSAIFRSYHDLFEADRPRHPHLFSAFLATAAKIQRATPYLRFAVDLGVQVPEYEVDNFLFFDDHYTGGYIFRDKINIAIRQRLDSQGRQLLRYGFDSRSPNRVTRTLIAEPHSNGSWDVCIPIRSRARPGIAAQLRIMLRSWN